MATIPPPPPHTACGVCGHVLNHYAGPFGESWMHALDSDNDHPAVPVPVDSIHTKIMCDFCLAENARWELPVEDYSSTGVDQNVGNWAACDDCAALLGAGDWENLTLRAMAAMRRRHPGGVPPRAAFDVMYEQVRKHVIGEVRLVLRAPGPRR